MLLQSPMAVLGRQLGGELHVTDAFGKLPQIHSRKAPAEQGLALVGVGG